MCNSEKKDLTRPDALEKMCDDIREIARIRRFGRIWYPTMANPSIVCEVHNGLVTQAEVLFINVDHNSEKVPILPDHTAKYRSD